MADTPYPVLCQQNDIDRVPAVRTQRRRPKTTLMDCVLRTPLKGPVTPPSVRPEKKRKLRSVSSSLNENIILEPFATKSSRRNGYGGSRRSSIIRMINSGPSSVIHARNDPLCSAPGAFSVHNDSSSYRPTKRPRITSLEANAVDVRPMQEHDGEEEFGRELHCLDLDEPQFMTGDGNICESSQLIIRMRERLEIEKKARRNAEENHLVELQKRLEMEQLVETLRHRLLSRVD